MKPIIFWIAGIAILTLLLVAGGGFESAMVLPIAGVMVVALLVAFFLFRRR